MGDPSVEVTEEMRDAAQSEKSKAIDAISEGIAWLRVITFFHCHLIFLNVIVYLE